MAPVTSWWDHRLETASCTTALKVAPGTYPPHWSTTDQFFAYSQNTLAGATSRFGLYSHGLKRAHDTGIRRTLTRFSTPASLSPQSSRGAVTLGHGLDAAPLAVFRFLTQSNI